MEDKKADIDILEELIRDYRDEKEFVGEEIIKAIETIISENKELKEEKEELKRKERLIKTYKGNFPEDVEFICLCKSDFERNISDDYISKDKIKAKIEELDKEEKEALKGTKGQDRYEIKQEYIHKRSVLQSLLEKEE